MIWIATAVTVVGGSLIGFILSLYLFDKNPDTGIVGLCILGGTFAFYKWFAKPVLCLIVMTRPTYQCVIKGVSNSESEEFQVIVTSGAGMWSRYNIRRIITKHGVRYSTPPFHINHNKYKVAWWDKAYTSLATYSDEESALEAIKNIYILRNEGFIDDYSYEVVSTTTTPTKGA
jgi:hypothetical protein